MNEIKPTLSDREVLDFCKKGYLILEGVISDEINQQMSQFMEDNSEMEPNELLHEEFFVNDILLNPQVAGAVRSLLGKNFALPVVISSHKTKGIRKLVGNWHRDGGSLDSDLFKCNYLQVFYYPQDTTVEMGPTELLPGTHLVYHDVNYMGHLGSFNNSILTAAKAGTVFITSYAIWHRATSKTDPATRNLLKYNYWRTVPPERDWVIDPEFDFETEEYRTKYKGQTIVPMSNEPTYTIVKMFYWLCGKVDEFHTIGGQSWPLDAHIALSKDLARELNQQVRASRS